MAPPADPAGQDPPPLAPKQLLKVQGDIWSKGFPKYNETYYFFSIEKPAEFNHCLKELVKGERPLISNLATVKKDQEKIAAHKKEAEADAIKKGKTAKEAEITVKDLANALIAFSFNGLIKIQEALPEFNLNLSAIESTDPGFSKGMGHKDVKKVINDPDKGTWHELFRSNKIHGLLKIGGSSEAEVDKLLDRVKAALRHETGVIKDVVGKSEPTEKNSRVDGATRPGKLRGKEHFGFEDGISQPLMGGIDKLEPKPDGKEGFVKNMNTDPELLIVTGGSASANNSVPRPSWMHNGSFLVFRKLEQHVGAFKDLTAKYTKYNCKDAAHMGAKLMGRWQSGAPIAMSDFLTQDSTDADTAKLLNNFGYRDKVGCPVAAHVRKTNVRENFGPNEGDSAAPRVRIIRNGIPYGTEYTGDNSTRGLLFACYQACIEDGFQHMQGNWANGKDFRTTDAGLDPIIGQPKNGKIITKITDQEGLDKEVEFEPLVTLKGGGYFFVPSIEALEKGMLADPPERGAS